MYGLTCTCALFCELVRCFLYSVLSICLLLFFFFHVLCSEKEHVVDKIRFKEIIFQPLQWQQAEEDTTGKLLNLNKHVCSAIKYYLKKTSKLLLPFVSNLRSINNSKHDKKHAHNAIINTYIVSLMD